jgi:membrane-associated protease RseP (regulator of RpoE activity)
MRKRRSNRWLTVLISAPLALLLFGTCMAGPPEQDRRIETIVIGEDADPDLLWIEQSDSAFLGVTVEEETEHEEGGARVTSVVDESPAAAAGIQEGDIIIQFGGDTVRGPVSLTTKIHARDPGEEVTVVLLRDGKKVKLDAKLGDRKENLARTYKMSFFGQLPEHLVVPEIDLEIDGEMKEHMERLQDRFIDLESCDEEEGEEDCGFRFYTAFTGRPKLGVQLVETTPELREHLGGSEEAGVLVSKVLSGTPAREAGVMVGDLIVEIDGEAVVRSSDIRRLLQGKEGSTVALVVIRDGDRLDIAVELPEPEEDFPTGPRALLAPHAACASAPLMVPAVTRRAIKLQAPAAAAPMLRKLVVPAPVPAPSVVPRPLAPPAPPKAPHNAKHLTYV